MFHLIESGTRKRKKKRLEVRPSSSSHFLKQRCLESFFLSLAGFCSNRFSTLSSNRSLSERQALNFVEKNRTIKLPTAQKPDPRKCQDMEFIWSGEKKLTIAIFYILDWWQKRHCPVVRLNRTGTELCHWNRKCCSGARMIKLGNFYAMPSSWAKINNTLVSQLLAGQNNPLESGICQL